MADIPLPNITPEEQAKIKAELAAIKDGTKTVKDVLTDAITKPIVPWSRRIAYLMSVLAFFGVTVGGTVATQRFMAAPPDPVPDVKPEPKPVVPDPLLEAIKGLRTDMKAFGSEIIKGQDDLSKLIKESKPKPPPTPASPTLTAPKSALPGEVIKTSWTLPSGSKETASVWLSKEGVKDERFANGDKSAVTWRYTGGKPGSASFDLGQVLPGRYEFRLGEWDGAQPASIFAKAQIQVMGVAPLPPPEPKPDPKPDPKPKPPDPPAPSITLNEFGTLVYGQALKVNRKAEAKQLSESYAETVSAIRAGGVSTPAAAVKMLFERNKGILGASAGAWNGFFTWADNELTRRNEKGLLSTMAQHADHFEQFGAALRKAGE